MKQRNLPFGYAIENGKVIIHEAEAAIIREVADRYLGGSSLKAIAGALTARQIEYMPGRSDWNKSRIQRMIDDKRYIGGGGYPPILTKQAHTAMQTIKAEKNTQKAVDHSVGIFRLTVPVVCPSCGGKMRRCHDKRRKASTWWSCSACKTTVSMTDEELRNGITERLNEVIADPERIKIPESAYEESQEVKRMNAEITKTLDTFGFDKEALKQKMLACVSEKYKCLRTEVTTAQSLKDICKTASTLTAYDSALADQTISEIRLQRNGEINLILINGQRIGREETA